MTSGAITFRRLFGGLPEVATTAHGRVNLMGDHTDYNDGFVLPMSIPQRTRVELSTRGDATVRVTSENRESGEIFTYQLGAETVRRSWADYVQGVTVALRTAGFKPCGFDARIASNVPVGAGVSSSAALEVALLRAMRAAMNLELDDVLLAKIARAAETDFVGAPIGIMDQMASSLATDGAAIFLDTRSLIFDRVPLPDDIDVIVVDSGVTHDHATGGYRIRREECERAACLLGVPALRDITPDRAFELERLPEPIRRRARHVVSENQRVVDVVAALRSGSRDALRSLFAQSHDSLRDDFEVSVAEIDAMVDAARGREDVLGVRMTGGGFGGAVVALVRSGAAAGVAAALRDVVPGARVLVPESPS